MKLEGKKSVMSVLILSVNCSGHVTKLPLEAVLLGKGKKKFNLPGGESNPGLPRDRRGYSPLYYRGYV